MYCARLFVSLHHQLTKQLELVTTSMDTAVLEQPKTVAHDMTVEELYAAIEQDVKAIYQEDALYHRS